MRKGRVKVTEDYVSMVFSSRTMVLPPNKHDQSQDNRANGQVEASDSMLQRVPVLSKKIPDGCDYRHPESGSHEIED